MQIFKFLVCLLFIVGLLQGCGSIPSIKHAKVEWSDSVATLDNLEKATSMKRSAAVVSMLRQSRGFWSEDNYKQGMSVLYRALRIGSDDPIIYYYIAITYYKMGENNQAVQLASRSLLLTDDVDFTRQVKLFIAKVKQLENTSSDK